MTNNHIGTKNIEESLQPLIDKPNIEGTKLLVVIENVSKQVKTTNYKVLSYYVLCDMCENCKMVSSFLFAVLQHRRVVESSQLLVQRK